VFVDSGVLQTLTTSFSSLLDCGQKSFKSGEVKAKSARENGLERHAGFLGSSRYEEEDGGSPENEYFATRTEDNLPATRGRRRPDSPSVSRAGGKGRREELHHDLQELPAVPVGPGRGREAALEQGQLEL